MLVRLLLFSLCTALIPAVGLGAPAPVAEPIKPRVITQPTKHDTDDPAIWIHPDDRAKSLVLGTDKHADGALYVYDLDGRIVQRVGDLQRPNNVDVGYGFAVGGRTVDIAVVTEREKQRLRVFSVPDMQPLDNGDLIVFGGDTQRAPMGVALYRRPRDGAFFVLVGGKSGPRNGYLAQYRLTDDGRGRVAMRLVREFGRYSGKAEIEAIAVDAELGYVYYSDEGEGVRKYAADPDVPHANEELALFARSGFAGDHEGISIYKHDDGTGFILVSDQQANRFQIFKREGEPERPHQHALVKTVPVAANGSDGSEVTSVPLGPRFPHGLFVAMSNGRVFHLYAWEDVTGTELRRASSAVNAASVTPLRHAHAHNDYLHPRPLLDALDQGFCGVEADIHLVKGELLVAHGTKEIVAGRTLAALYLDPLRARVRANDGRVYRGGPTITLLIDLKTEAVATYRALHEVLAPYADMLTTYRGGNVVPGAVQVIISGNRPFAELQGQPVRYAALDGRPPDLDTSYPAALVPWISADWNKTFTWRWQGEMPEAEQAALARLVQRAHEQGRKVRFWNTPDRPHVWQRLRAAGIDVINADDLAGLSAFLRQRADPNARRGN